MASDPLTNEDRLDEILLHLRRIDRRDRLRTWGGFFRSLFSLIPTLLLLFGLWYFYENGATIMQWITQETAKQAAAVAIGASKGTTISLRASPDVIQELKKMLHIQQ